MAVGIKGIVKRRVGKLKAYEDEKVKAGALAIALEVERQAKLNAPVDHGPLRASIEAGTDEDGAFVRTNVKYAAFQEFGTMQRGHITDPGPTPPWYQHSEVPGGVPAQPFMRPAFYAVVGRAADIMRRTASQP